MLFINYWRIITFARYRYSFVPLSLKLIFFFSFVLYLCLSVYTYVYTYIWCRWCKYISRFFFFFIDRILTPFFNGQWACWIDSWLFSRELNALWEEKKKKTSFFIYIYSIPIMCNCLGYLPIRNVYIFFGKYVYIN